MKPTHRLRFLLLQTSAALALFANQATAATFTWSGATSADYTVAGNWSGGVAPTTNVATNEVTIDNNTNVASMVIVPAGTYYVKSLTFGASNTANTRFVLAGSAGVTANTRPLVFSSDTGTATLTVSGTGNKTIDRVARVDDGGTNTMSLTSHLDVVHNGSGNLTLGNGENANTNWGIRIVGAGNINKSGTGTMILAGNNTYTGATNINAGALTIQRSASLGGTGGGTSVTATGASLQLNGTTFGALAVAGEALSLNGTGISGNGALRNLGGANSWSGAVTLAGAATIQSDADSLTFTGGITNGGNTLTVQGAADTTVSTAGISGAGGLTKTGVGTLTLSNTANTFSGQVLSDSGTIQVTKLENNGTASSVGAGSSSIRLGNDATATLEYIGTTDSSTNKAIQIGTNTITNTGNATILNNSASGKLTFTGTTFNSNVASVTAARALTLGGTYTGAANEIQGIIQNNGSGTGVVSLTKTGASTWQLSGANTYTGATTITTGTLQLDGSTHASSTVGIGTAGTLSGSGTVNGNATLTGGGIINKSAGSIAGALGVTGGNWNGAGSVTGLVTSSSGTFTIGSGANLTATSGVSATGGALIVNGTLTGTLNANSSTTVSGTGTITGNTTISGIHSPGNSPGIQSYGSNLSYTTGSSVTWELGVDALGIRGTDFDGINVGGALDFSGATTVNLVFNFAGSTVDWTDTFWDTSHTGTSGWLVYDVAGTTTNFANLSVTAANWLDGSGGLFNTSNSGNTFSLFQDGSDIYLNYTAIPEPNVAGLLGGLGTLVLLRRRR